MSDLLDEAHEFLLCMDETEYADALFALRAELTEARRQLKEASEQEPAADSRHPRETALAQDAERGSFRRNNDADTDGA